MALDASPRAHGHRLSVLRNIFGLAQADLAVRLDVSQSFLSHVERGSRPVPASLVVQASREFSVPDSFFAVRPSPTDAGPVTFRKNSRASVRDEIRVVAFYDEAARLFRHVSSASGFHAAVLPDPIEFENDPELVAEAMRDTSGLRSDEPVLNATRTLERSGIGVVDNLDHLGEEARGHTAVSRPSHLNDRPLVGLAADVPGAVKRLTVMHEVGHLIFDRDLSEPVSGTRSPEERRAYRFAGAFLLPEKVVRQRVSETLNLHGYLPIKADYGISVGAIIMRARDIGVVSSHRARSLQIQLSSQGWRTNEPVPVPGEKPSLLGQALRKVYGTHAATKAAHDVGTSPQWIDQWIYAHDEELQPEPGNVIDLAAARTRRNR